MKAMRTVALVLLVTLSGVSLGAQSGTPGPAIREPRVVCDRWPSHYDAASWAADVFRIENAQTQEEKAIALWGWVRLLQHWGDTCGDGTRGIQLIEQDAIKKINIFPFGQCSDFSITAAALGTGGGLNALEVHLEDGSHTQFDVVYRDADGVERYHRLDGLWGIGVYDRTGTRLATWQEIKADPTIATSPTKTLLPWGDKVDDRMRFAEKAALTPSHRVRPSLYTMDKSLFPGETYALRWQKEAIRFYNNHPDPVYNTDQEEGGFQRFLYANGNVENLTYGHERLRPHVQVGTYGSDSVVKMSIGHGRLALIPILGPGFQDSVHQAPANTVVGGNDEAKLRPATAGTPATLVYAVRSPYVLADASFSGSFRAGPNDLIRVSIAFAEWRQRNYTLDQVLPASPVWTTVWQSSGAGPHLMNLGTTGLPLRGEYQYLVKLEMTAATDATQVGIDALSFAHHFQQNMLALPRLMPGRNVIRVTAAEIRPGYALKVEYAWDDALGVDRRDVRLIDRVPLSYEITAAGQRPADVRTRSVVLQAVKLGTGSDQDNDGMPDSWEQAYGLNPNDPVDSSGDLDRDGATNLQEYLAGTDPTIANPPAGGGGGGGGSGGCGATGMEVFGFLGVLSVLKRRQKAGRA